MILRINRWGMTAHVPPSSAYKKNRKECCNKISRSNHFITYISWLFIQYRGKKMKDSSLAINNNNNNIKTTSNSSSGNSNKLCVTVVGSSAVGKTGSSSFCIWFELHNSFFIFQIDSIDSSVPEQSIHRWLLLRNGYDLSAFFLLYGRIT